MTYEERVQQIAEEMAMVEYANTYKSYVKYTTTHANSNCWSAGFYRQQWPVLIARYAPFARIAAKHMAQAFEDGARWGEGWRWSEYELPDEMKDRGLIPPKEGGEDEI